MTAEIEEANQRQSVYRFFASAYLQAPDENFVEAARAMGIGADEDLESLRREFQQLFIVPLGVYTTPYEAVYRDERDVAGERVKGLLMGPSTVDVIQCYKDAGAKREEISNELPDHIGVELGFMAFLCEHEAESLREGCHPKATIYRERGYDFLEKHLMQWVPLLADRIRKSAKLTFYRDITNALETFLNEELDNIGSAVNPSAAVGESSNQGQDYELVS